jgi:hypothetical protein
MVCVVESRAGYEYSIDFHQYDNLRLQQRFIPWILIEMTNRNEGVPQ